MRLVPALVSGLIAMAACAEAPASLKEGPPNGLGTPLPDVAEIVCEADGTTSILTPEIVVQSDGVHIHVRVLLDEPIVIDGLRWDDQGPEIQAGQSDILVTEDPPGSNDLACWPVSEIGSESFEPTRRGLEIVDPRSVYVSEEPECLPGDETAGWSSDFGPEGPDIEPPITAEQAEGALRRLEPGDVVTYVGYPERPMTQIAVVRDGRSIAVMSFMHEGKKISSYDGGICQGEAVLPPGIN